MKKVLLSSLLVLSSKVFAAAPVVLVHGALFTADSWAPLQTELAASGIYSVATDMPGRKGDGVDPKSISIETAAKKVCQVIEAQKEPVILVGHSQGGAVINQALAYCADKVVGLIYVAAVAPKSGTVAFAALDPKRDVNFAKCATANPEKMIFELNSQGPLAQSFFQEIVGTKKAVVAVASMVSEPMGIGTTTLNYPEESYKKLKKLYVLTKGDRVVTPETQKAIVKDIPNVQVKAINAGHSPQLTHTKQVAKLITTFAK